jgi:hypothetical protein
MTDWHTTVCIASGPSLTLADVERVQQWRAQGNGRVIVTNTTWTIAPWADVLYAVDRKWWDQYLPMVRHGFRGERVTHCHYVGVSRAHSINVYNSGANAIALAAHRGAKRIILIGYDVSLDGALAHWHEDHPAPLKNANSISEWPKKFAEVAKVIEGVDVVNCSRRTALTAFRRGTLDELDMMKAAA